MRRPPMSLIGMLWLSLCAACSSGHHIPQPIVERGDGALSSSEDSTLSHDLQTCREDVCKAAPMSMQPRWLPPLGSAANGVVLGTSDTPHAVWPSREAYRQTIERCLTDRGYKVRGWQ